MKHPLFSPVLVLLAACGAAVAAPSIDPRIPEPLRAWEGWVLWGQDNRNCPSPYNDAAKHFCLWPSRLALDVNASGARFDYSLTVFNESWVPLPGGGDHWPQNVKSNGALVPVVERDGRPAVKLPSGTHRLEGGFSWKKIPQKIPLSASIGMVALTLDGKPVENPLWDASGQLWLERNASSGEADKDFLSVKLFAELADGIPLWLHGEVEMIVSGKSREEALGAVLPQGWKLASLEGPIPVAVDEDGRIKAQVRPGKWTVKYSAFRLDNPKEFRFAPGLKPAAPDELVAFRSQPDFRLVEIAGSPSVDVSQIAFPERWRELPVYRWDTAMPFRIEERMRGMGLQKPAGLNIAREWWLDENGGAFTFRDRLTGQMQEIWRLDAAKGQDLGSVRSDGNGQLITRSPLNGAPGVEIRSRAVNLEATGRMERAGKISASGWQTDAEALRVTLNLPPGWRLFALFGADWVRGDWLTSWTLLDLFLLLIFTLAVGKLWGWRVAALAFVAFGLAYHEPGAPRYVWLWLLIPLALLRAVRDGWGRRILLAGKWIIIAAFVFIVVPFASRQIQQAIYPQMELPSLEEAPVALRGEVANQALAVPAAPAAAGSSSYGFLSKNVAGRGDKVKDTGNLTYDTKARIQTGPGVPDWTWRSVSFGWNGPVTAAQEVRPVMVPIGIERLLAVLRVALVLGLAGLLLRGGRVLPAAGLPAALLALLVFLPAANAQMPDEKLLETLRARLTEKSDAYPNAAAIPQATLRLAGNRMEMDVGIDAAIAVAVPLPGRLPAWSPVSVSLDGKPAAALRREDGYLWVPVPQGVHQVKVAGLLPDVPDWEWTFLLKPRSVVIEAPEWTVNGVSAGGVPDQQVFFTKILKSTPGEAAYDRQDFTALASVERRIELGLVWHVRTTVARLSPGGKAIALRVPLLEGENVLSSNAQIKDGRIEVRLGAQQEEFQWESELGPSASLSLAAGATDPWTEVWQLVASPVWNVTISGLAPVFEPGNPDLVPVWHPWPGEGVKLGISRPEAVPGATVTVEKASHEVTPGMRQRTSVLNLGLRCSLGEDFSITLPADAEVSSLTLNGAAIPARMDSRNLIVPLRPGEQSAQVEWKTGVPLGVSTRVEEVGLPVGSANINTVINIPDSRWVLWADGPLRGPAVRFWTVLACSLIAAWLLGRLASSPLGTAEWMLLGIGLTQVPLPAALLVVGWLFYLSWRGSESYIRLPAWGFNLLQLALIALTAMALAVFVAVVAEGLLGNPEMFIAGNGSTRSALRWYQARCGEMLPQPGCVSVSIWWFRLLMLAWALWLAAALLRWLRLAWVRFSTGGCFRGGKKTAVPPPLAPPPAL
ncbi:MAG: hypothetical protein WC003_13785 [Terrimicrobiaceae bacterium]